MPPGHHATELDWLIFVQNGVLTWRQAVEELGTARARRQLSSGRWRTICRGVLLTHNGPLTGRAALWVAVLAAGRGALLAGLTAAAEAGLRRFRSDAIHLLVPARRGYTDIRRLPAEMPVVVVRRTSNLPESHIQIGRPQRTTTARALVDAAQWADTDDEARSILAAGCRSASSRRPRSSLSRTTCHVCADAHSQSRPPGTPKAEHRPSPRSVL